jgi:hypothetical protein
MGWLPRCLRSAQSCRASFPFLMRVGWRRMELHGMFSWQDMKEGDLFAGVHVIEGIILNLRQRWPAVMVAVMNPGSVKYGEYLYFLLTAVFTELCFVYWVGELIALGWIYMSALGWIYVSALGWIYVSALGWIYVSALGYIYVSALQSVRRVCAISGTCLCVINFIFCLFNTSCTQI